MIDLKRVEGLPWALDERFFRSMFNASDVLAVDPSALQEFAARRGANRRAAQPGSVAVIPIHGAIEQRTSIWEDFGFEVSTETLGASLAAALDDPNVAHIVLDVDSPGGSVFGIEELGAKIRAAREVKPITAVANSFMASAAYWLASQAGEVVVTPGGMTGSVGVIAAHVDMSGAMANEGVRVEFITAGKYKAEGNSYEPLGAEARERMQYEVDAYYEKFIRTVAEGRKVSMKRVRDDFGQGRVLLPEEAVAVGMVDRIASFEDVVGGILSKSAQAGASALAAESERERAAARARAARAKVALAGIR